MKLFKRNSNKSKLPEKQSITQLTPDWIHDISKTPRSTSSPKLSVSTNCIIRRESSALFPLESMSPMRASHLSRAFDKTEKMKKLLKTRKSSPQLFEDYEQTSPTPIETPKTPSKSMTTTATTINSPITPHSSSTTTTVIHTEMEDGEVQYQNVDTEEVDDTLSDNDNIDCILSSDEDDTAIIEEQDEGLNGCKSNAEKLFYACEMDNDRGLATVSSILFATKININNYKNKRKNYASLLHFAARSNNIQCMLHLMSLGADVNIKDAVHATPLHYACASNARDAAILLLSNGANVNGKDQYEVFPLLLAMKNNHLEMMQVLLDFKADVHMKTKKGQTCLHIACMEGFLNRAQYLVTECKASVSRLNDSNEHSLFAALKYPSLTELICQSVDSYSSFCRMLAVTNCLGQTVIHYACEKGYLEGLLVIVRTVHDLGIPTVGLTVVDDTLTKLLNEYDVLNGLAPIHIAVLKGHKKVVKYLALSSQVDIDRQEVKFGDTALHMAIQERMDEICEILIHLGKANIKVKNGRKESCKRLSDRTDFTLPQSKKEGKRLSLQAVTRSTSNLFRSKSGLNFFE